MAHRKIVTRKTSRRKLLQSLTGGITLGTATTFAPSSWVKPVVDAVVLPTHAQTSPQICTPDTVMVDQPPQATVIYGVNQYQYTVSATGAAPLWFGFSQAPTAATIDSATGEIFWDPLLTYPQFPPGPSGTFEVQVIDANGCDGSVTWTVDIAIPG